ncbi:MAG: hypothetical protein IPP57_12205 [Candidatus Obscuribacter sp.]|nr:hypothetical protein [Candidatus Obscuribacter sp.]
MPKSSHLQIKDCSLFASNDRGFYFTPSASGSDKVLSHSHGSWSKRQNIFFTE